MSAEERALAAFDRLLADVGERADEIGPRPIASMWPHVGSAYRPGGVFILGQALDGWDPDECSARWHASEARNADGRERIIHGTRAWHADAPEPIAPVLEVGKRRGSTFWLFSHALVDRLVPDGSLPWYGRYAWGNLYPLGHDRPKSYPTGALKEAQDEHVADLLMAQVEMLDPAVVVLVCGPWYWWSARNKPAELEALTPADRPLLATGVIEGRSWVVGLHPGGASRSTRTGPYAYAELIAETVQQSSIPPRRTE
ncbi:MAG TPA: hypothetical protein VHR55_09165 [Candidatus Limnocylindria bacterium]|nr:hypothetical protein [Candidatus Limnocylindria bacterium]